MKIISLHDRWDDGYPYYRVPVEDESQCQELIDLAQEKGLQVTIDKADTYDQAMKFVKQL